MTTKRIRPWRRWVQVLQALLILGLPYLRIRGESALRFDVPSLTLHFFGEKIGMDEFFLVLVAVLFLGFLLILLTILFGRIWCGWLCPQTVIIDLTRFVDRSAYRNGARRTASLVLLLGISAVIAASLLWYFVSPYEFIPRLLEGRLGPILGGFWAGLTVVTFLNFAFLRHGFCRTVCPYAKMQEALYDERTLRIAPDLLRMQECMHCDACVRVCPVRIDVREGLNAACINCAECIDACARQMDRRGLRSLIDYRFGTKSKASAWSRRGLILSALATAVFLALLLSQIVTRPPLDVTIATDPSQPPRLSSSGNMINTYVLALTNRTGSRLTVQVSARYEAGELAVLPDMIDILPDTHIRSSIEIDAGRDVMIGSSVQTVHLSLKILDSQMQPIELDAAFLAPW